MYPKPIMKKFLLIMLFLLHETLIGPMNDR